MADSSSYDDGDDIGETKSKSSGTDNSAHSGHDDTHSSDTDDQKVISKQENLIVSRSKTCVLIVIAIAAVALGLATFFFIRNEEEDGFENTFYEYAIELVDVANQEAKTVFGTVESVSTSFTSLSIEEGTVWPNFTIPHFEIRGSQSNELSKALQMSVVPLITQQGKPQWEAYSVENQGWIQEGLNFEAELGLNGHAEDFIIAPRADPIPTKIYRHQDGDSGFGIPQDSPGVDFGSGNYGPVWQQAPAPHDTKIINYDLLSHSVFERVYRGMWETMLPVLSEVTDLEFLYGGAVQDNKEHPHSVLLHPLYPTFSKEHHADDIVGFIAAVLPWDVYFTNVLSDNVHGISVVLHNTCGDHHTYIINGPKAEYLGPGDLHDPKYSHLEVTSEFAPFLDHTFSEKHEHCEYDLRIYPTSALEDELTSNKSWIYCLVVVVVFAFTSGVFMAYDMLVQNRQSRLVAKASRTNAIVKSLFPANVRDRILKDAEEQAESDINKGKKSRGLGAGAKSQLKDFLDDDVNDIEVNVFGSKPIADLFPSTTVMFADIVGFTAWSSAREPSQVFTLLETIYSAFDEIAKRKRVFKVETIGDCYVAVCGLPDPRPDHAVVMARFSRDCLTKMNDLTKKLEVSLGPDTADLSMRIGLHSGPVTAGVLRGDKSRFQLFGDTVNTAARVEASGQRNKIHLSEVTVDLLGKAGKEHWFKQREDLVQAKGKGELKTFWLDLKLPSAASITKSGGDASSNPGGAEDVKHIEAGLKKFISEKNEKIQRLVNWNVDVLHRLLKQIVARHGENLDISQLKYKYGQRSSGLRKGSEAPDSSPDKMVIDEVVEIIHLPAFDAERKQLNPESIEIPEDILSQLKDYVTIIATLYQDNPFHNFEHASHVTMSVVKLLGRIVAPDNTAEQSGNGQMLDQVLHDHTYGITSDPLTQFACVFAALIHDVDHAGVPNATLIKEKARIAAVYKNKSVAEQNSVDMAWDLFMDRSFDGLRSCICGEEAGRKRFRSLVVNAVMATDIVDKELKAARNARWEKAFSENATDDCVTPSTLRDGVNRKATIVIEHLIQASDVAHTMQHWHIYRKWNARLFEEMYVAYLKGRSDKDPSEFWYKGEIGFFDFYIIPLAKKLKNCGVFGVSSDEYLNYAEKNREEWEAKGQEVVASLIAKYKDMDVGPKEVPTEPAQQESRVSGRDDINRKSMEDRVKDRLIGRNSSFISSDGEE